MDNQRFVGILLRFLRLQRNWSQETLCHGICAVSYIAATKVEFGDYVGGYNYFARLETPEIMDLHKLAICCEALGKNDEAFCALERAAQVDAMPLQKQMCDLVRYRLENPAYLHDSVYGDLLMDTFERIREELHFGYARFHLRWVTQWLTANRQYRSAFELLQNFPKSGAKAAFQQVQNHIIFPMLPPFANSSDML